MEEIKVNDYIKTKNGYIAQIININDFREPSMKYGVEANYLSDILFIGEENITKHSSNIIDLIEAGDYVNGYKVKYVCNEEPCPSGKYVDIDCELDSSESYFFDNEIKSIVTKKQFEAMEYRIQD